MTQLMNCPEFVFAYVACHKIHAVGSPVSYRLSPGELAQNLLDAHPKVLVFDAGKKDDVLEAMKIANLKPSRLIVVEGEGGGEERFSHISYLFVNSSAKVRQSCTRTKAFVQ